MESLLQDIRYAARSLMRSPAFTIAAVATLAIGIGATTAIFSVVDAVLLRGAPLDDIARVAMVWQTDRNSGTLREPASIPDFADFKARSRSFERLAAFAPVELNYAPGVGDPARIAALSVSHDYLATLGLSVMEGRTFTPDEDQPGGPRSVIISEDLWERAFQRDRAAIGKTVRLNDAEWEVVGVLPREADFGVLQVLGVAAYQRGFADRGGRARVDAWVPLRPSPDAPRSNHPIFVIGRLAAGATATAAHQEMATISAELERLYAQDNVNRGTNVELLADVVFGQVRTVMYLLIGAVAMVLLVACVNVANLLLVRATNRIREVTVRSALGAGAGRLAQQFMVEGALLALAGTLGGLFIAYGAVESLVALAPATIPRAAEIAVDGRVLVVVTGVATLVAVVFGLLPTLQSRRLDLQGTLREDGGRGASAGAAHKRLRSSLVVAELAMATTLMVGAGLLIRSLWTLQAVNPGFATAGVLKAEFQLPASRYPQNFAEFPNWPARQQFFESVGSKLAAMPGVTSVAFAAANPLDAGFTSSIRVVGRESEAANWPEPSIRPVSASYFNTMAVPVTDGRAFDATDATTSAPVLMINEAANRRFFNGMGAVGQQVFLWGVNRTVVGIAGNERFKGLAVDVPPAVYLPLTQAPTANSVIVRMAGDASAGAALVRRAVREVDPQLPLFGVEPLEETLNGTLAQRRFTMMVLFAFAAAALVLACVGVHGVLSYSVAQRSREIGVRVALGADVRRVRDLVMGDGIRLAAIGLGIGLAGALALSQMMGTLLYGVGPRDPLTFFGVATVLGVVAVVASYLPARRAARIDPVVSLRAD